MFLLVVLAALLIPVLLVGGILALFWKRKRRLVLRWCAIAYAGLVLLVLLGIGPYLMAWLIVHAGTRPPDRALKSTPGTYGVIFEDVVFEARDAVHLGGWFVPPSGRNTILICTHGLFRNRVETLSRIVPLARTGYGALLYDSRSHGSSDKALVSFGYAEKNDVLGAMDYVSRRYQDAPNRPAIVLLGVSMGAVATLEAAAESRGYSAIVLDSPFSNLRDTVVRHVWLFLKLPRYPFPSLFLFWFQHLTGADPDRIDSLEAIRKTQPVPLLVIASEGDERMGTDAARALYEQSNATFKKLELFGKDVPHGAAARIYPEDYVARLTAFLDQALRKPEESLPDLPGPPATAPVSK